jgi:hypothetical protein
MKIVMEYTVGGAYEGNDIVECFEYDGSIEQFLVDFESVLLKTKLEVEESKVYHNGDFAYCGKEFYFRDFLQDGKVFLPEVYELEEWFKGKIS